MQELGKASLEECSLTNKSNQDKDLQFGRNFFRGKAASLTEAQKQELAEFEVGVCKTVNFDDFNRFVSVLRDNAQDLALLRYTGFTQLLPCRKLTDRDFKFCRTFWRRNTAENQQVEELQAAILRPTTDSDRVALRPAVTRALSKFENILERRHAEFVALGAPSVTSLFGRHVKKQDSEARACYWFLSRIFPRLNEDEQQRVRGKLNDLLSTANSVPCKQHHQAKLHQEETILADALPRSRLPKSLRQLYGNSMDAESRVMTFFNRVHKVDCHMMSLEFQDCDYCHEGWFGTRVKRQHLPGGFESEAYKKTNFLQAAQTQWLDPARPICENCSLEAKRRVADGMPKEPLRFTSANFADPGETLPETDALTFFEEEILSPIQHIVRIFTLRATGQCELRGHVGNLFQNGPQYVRNIPAAIGDMKMLLIRRCPKDPNRKQRIPFLVSRRRLERALDRVCRPLSEGGLLALQPGALTPAGYVDLVKAENLLQFSDTEEGEEPQGLEVHVVEQTPWERVERKLFAMWMSCNLELQMAAEVRLLHEPQEEAPSASDGVGMSLRTTDNTSENQEPGDSAGMSLRTARHTREVPRLQEVERVEALWTNLRAAMKSSLASYLSLQLNNKTVEEAENILHDEFTAVQELASWEEPLVSEGLWSPEDLGGQQTEQELKEDLWDAVCKANESTSSKASILRFGAPRAQGVPILDLPTVSSRNQLIREDQPYYIVAGFVKLFPLGSGDYWAHLQQRQHEAQEPLAFWEWLKHFLLRSDGRFQCHPRFYFFALNTALRNKALRARAYFLKRQQTVSTNNVAYATEELFRMGKAQFTKIVSAFEHSMAGSAQEKLRQRSDLEAMVEQIEQETLEEQAHALLHSWQTAVCVTDVFQEKGLVKVARQMRRVCDAAKQTIDKVLSPETIGAAPKPTIARVVAGHAMGGQPEVACVVADRATEPDQVLASACYENVEGQKRSVEDLLTEVEQRSCVFKEEERYRVISQL